VTALCSPTRAVLLTGRNHHAVGFGSIGEFSSGFPGYTAFVPEDSAPFPKVLQQSGYSTAAFGKWHMTPDGQQGAAGQSASGGSMSRVADGHFRRKCETRVILRGRTSQFRGHPRTLAQPQLSHLLPARLGCRAFELLDERP
jgi:arylsulfatase A-like enzyme